MKKEIKNFEKSIQIILIILTIISLIINALQYTYGIYNMTYNTDKLNSLLISTPYYIVLWIDNILIYIFGLLNIYCSIKSKKEILLNVSISLFSILTTIVVATFIINFVANVFGLF